MMFPSSVTLLLAHLCLTSGRQSLIYWQPAAQPYQQSSGCSGFFGPLCILGTGIINTAGGVIDGTNEGLTGLVNGGGAAITVGQAIGGRGESVTNQRSSVGLCADGFG